MEISDWITKFIDWIEKHPIKSMFFVTIPICIVTSVITTLLLM